MSEDKYSQDVFNGYLAQNIIQAVGDLPPEVQGQLVSDWQAAGCPPIDYNYAQAAISNLSGDAQGPAQQAVDEAASSAALQVVDMNHDNIIARESQGGDIEEFQQATGWTGSVVDYYTGGNE